MTTEQDQARAFLDLQKRGHDFRLLDIPAYKRWSKRKLDEGVSDALIAHLDATCMFMLPEEVAEVEEDVFDEMLEELRADIGDSE
jgi:hypothetical protein